MTRILPMGGPLAISIAVFVLSFEISCREDHVPLNLTSKDIFGEAGARDLARAAAKGDRHRVDELLSKGVDINYSGEHGITPLWWAIMSDNYVGFAYLLDRGANPSARVIDGFDNIMQVAARMLRPDYLKKALSKGGNPNLVGEGIYSTPLLAAINRNRLDNIEILIDAGANIDAQLPISGLTPAMMAVMGGDFREAYLLLQKGADTTLRDKRGNDLHDILELLPANSEYGPKIVEIIERNKMDQEEKRK
jgi:ankyrin repeat protein